LIAPAEIRIKAERRYSGFLSSIVESRGIFPLTVPFAKAAPGEFASRWNELGAELAALRRESDEERPGKSYSVEWEERKDRLAGNQRFPASIAFPDEKSFLAFLGKAREVERFRADLAFILDAFPALRSWAAAKPLAIVERSGEWPRIVAVLQWLVANPASGLFIREVPAVEDTKFIESRKGIIRDLLDILSPEPLAYSRSERGFEARCGFKTAQPILRVRILDRAVADARLSGVGDLSLPLDRLACLNFPEIERVLVIENKTSFGRADVFLTAPSMAGTIALFGSGYASQSIGADSWISSRRIGYWGDIDSHGLRILGGFRAAFPAAESILMDEGTFDRFPEYRSDAPSDAGSEPEGLEPAELSLFRRLVAAQSRNRLEQERVPYLYASQRLIAWAEGSRA
jgi:Uncharacterized protein conserved in bacteria